MIIQSLTLFTNKLDAQLNFYTRRLGMKCIEKNNDFFTLDAGNTVLKFEVSNTPLISPYHFAFNIEPATINFVLHTLNMAGIIPIVTDNIVLHDFTNWNAKAIYFYDSDENIVEFIARFNIREPEEERSFTINDIINVSEMGIVVIDIPDFTTTVKKKLGQTIWKEYGPDFKAIGDEEGLLITVPVNRPWFPTQIKAFTLPAIIELTQEGESFDYLGYHFRVSQ
jgi:catechol 2,3-dioxygenase-like lactoylglutathione lyase family enzyme